jgi:hypothetical protein
MIVFTLEEYLVARGLHSIYGSPWFQYEPPVLNSLVLTLMPILLLTRRFEPGFFTRIRIQVPKLTRIQFVCRILHLFEN